MRPNHEDADVHALLAGTPEQQVQWLVGRAMPAAVLLPLFNACAQRCFFCAGPGTTGAPLGDRTPWAGIERQLSHRPEGVTRLLVGGNEPTLHPDFERALVEAGRCGYRSIEVMTNGATLRGRARDWADLGVQEVVVPLYSTRAEEHDAVCGVSCFADVLDGLIEAHSAGIRVRVHTLLLRRTLPGLGDLAEWVEDRFGTRLGVGLLRAKPLFTFESEAPSLGEIRAALARLRSQPELLAAPACLGWGAGDGVIPGDPGGTHEPPPALLARIYFLTQARRYVSTCDACPAKGSCAGIVDGYADALG